MAEGKTITIVQKGKDLKTVYFSIQAIGDTGGTINECTFHINIDLEEELSSDATIRLNASNRDTPNGMYSTDFTVTIEAGRLYNTYTSNYVDNCDLVVNVMKITLISASADGYNLVARSNTVTVR